MHRIKVKKVKILRSIFYGGKTSFLGLKISMYVLRPSVGWVGSYCDSHQQSELILMITFSYIDTSNMMMRNFLTLWPLSLIPIIKRWHRGPRTHHKVQFGGEMAAKVMRVESNKLFNPFIQKILQNSWWIFGKQIWRLGMNQKLI